MENAEINRKVAELMGIKFKTVPIGDVYYIGEDEILKFNPAEDISDAWILVDMVRRIEESGRFVSIIIKNYDETRGDCVFSFIQFLTDPKATLTICQAFIKVMEGK